MPTPLSPVERSYLDALNTARIDPEAGIAKFQAMIDLFQSPKDVSGAEMRGASSWPSGGSASSASSTRPKVKSNWTVVSSRIKRADELRKTDPQRAQAMYRAVIVLISKQGLGKRRCRNGHGGAGKKQSRVGQDSQLCRPTIRGKNPKSEDRNPKQIRNPNEMRNAQNILRCVQPACPVTYRVT